MQEGPSLHKTTEVVPLRVRANRLGALRFRLGLAMTASYLAMMAHPLLNKVDHVPAQNYLFL